VEGSPVEDVAGLADGFDTGGSEVMVVDLGLVAAIVLMDEVMDFFTVAVDSRLGIGYCQVNSCMVTSKISQVRPISSIWSLTSALLASGSTSLTISSVPTVLFQVNCIYM
jgi:hypothetical protein